MASLLVQAAESRVMLLQALERREGLRDSAELALAHRHQIQHVAVFRDPGGERLGRLQPLGQLQAFQERSYPPNLQYNRRRDWMGGGRVHHGPVTKKAGIAARLEFYASRAVAGCRQAFAFGP